METTAEQHKKLLGETTARQNEEGDADVDSSVVDEVFTSIDLLREILLFVVDEPHTTLLEANLISKSFYSALMRSEQIWKSVCQCRWSTKWGYQQRLQKAIDGAPSNGNQKSKSASTNATTNQTKNTTDDATATSGLNGASGSNSMNSRNNNNYNHRNSKEDGIWWRNQYLFNEYDSKRNYLIPEELTSMKFDFRFWLLEYYWGQENRLRTGLKRSITTNFQFSPTTDDDLSVICHHGLLHNHPSNRDDLEWFLDIDGQGLQWGKMPHLWPKARVTRLPSWGWQISNPNVCLRAIDEIPSSNKSNTKSKNEQNQRQQQQEQQQHQPNNANDQHNKLWKDLIESIQVYKCVNFGFGVNENYAHVEVPSIYWEFDINRSRFPRIE